MIAIEKIVCSSRFPREGTCHAARGHPGKLQGRSRGGRIEVDGSECTHGRGFCAEERVRQGERAWGWLFE